VNSYTNSDTEMSEDHMTEKAMHRNGPELLNLPMDRLAPYSHAGEDEVSISGFLDILAEHRELFLAVFLCVLAAGGAYIFGFPKKYASTMELLVTNNRSTQAISPGKTDATVPCRR